MVVLLTRLQMPLFICEKKIILALLTVVRFIRKPKYKVIYGIISVAVLWSSVDTGFWQAGCTWDFCTSYSSLWGWTSARLAPLCVDAHSGRQEMMSWLLSFSLPHGRLKWVPDWPRPGCCGNCGVNQQMGDFSLSLSPLPSVPFYLLSK